MSGASNSSNWEQELADLLTELSNVQDELLALLSAKQSSMASNDLAQMTELQSQEAALCDRLQACHVRRAELLQQARIEGLPDDSLENLAGSLNSGNSGQLKRQVKTASRRMRLLQHQSLANWVLAQRTVLHLAQMLEIIATGGRLQPTYGRGDEAVSRGALVDREA